MNISEAGRKSGLSAKTIRYYEEVGLISPASRGDNGYRQYDSRSLEELNFLARSREVGFDLEECRQLLELHRDHSRQSRHARELVLEKSQQLQETSRVLRDELEALRTQMDEAVQQTRAAYETEIRQLHETISKSREQLDTLKFTSEDKYHKLELSHRDEIAQLHETIQAMRDQLETSAKPAESE